MRVFIYKVGNRSWIRRPSHISMKDSGLYRGQEVSYNKGLPRKFKTCHSQFYILGRWCYLLLHWMVKELRTRLVRKLLQTSMKQTESPWQECPGHKVIQQLWEWRGRRCEKRKEASAPEFDDWWVARGEKGAADSILFLSGVFAVFFFSLLRPSHFIEKLRNDRKKGTIFLRTYNAAILI